MSSTSRCESYSIKDTLQYVEEQLKAFKPESLEQLGLKVALEKIEKVLLDLEKGILNVVAVTASMHNLTWLDGLHQIWPTLSDDMRDATVKSFLSEDIPSYDEMVRRGMAKGGKAIHPCQELNSLTNLNAALEVLWPLLTQASKEDLVSTICAYDSYTYAGLVSRGLAKDYHLSEEFDVTPPAPEELRNLRMEDARLRSELATMKQVARRYKEWIDGHISEFSSLNDRITCLEEAEERMLAAEKAFRELAASFVDINLEPLQAGTVKTGTFLKIIGPVVGLSPDDDAMAWLKDVNSKIPGRS